MKQSVLVLGANGFIGQAVVRCLAATDWAVPVLGLRRVSASGEATGNQRPVDATKADSIVTALQNVSCVVNCVAGDADTIVSSTRALCEASDRMALKPRIVHLSTMSVYGSATGRIDETHALRGDLGAYSAAKVTAETIAAGYARSVLMRPGCVFGPHSEQWSVRIARLLLAGRLGDLGAAGDGHCNLVHVDDVALAITLALTSPISDGRAYNLSTAESLTWNDYLVRYAIELGAVPVHRITRRRLKLETKLLAPPLKIAEIVARASKLPVSLPPPIPSSLLRLMGQDIRLDTARAQSELGIRWRDAGAAIADTARWYLQSGSAR